MANLPISQLPEVTAVTTNSEFVVVENGVTSKIKTNNIFSGSLYGSFYSMNDQFQINGANERYLMSAETVAYSQGIDVIDGTKFTVSSSGLYNVTFSTLFNRITGGDGAIITIWLINNGVNELNSGGEVATGIGDFNSKQLPSWNWMVYLHEGDYVEIAWSSTNENTYIHSHEEQTAPDRPGLPSVAVTITQV